MELKPYQKRVIADLCDYFALMHQDASPAQAFDRYWQNKAGAYNALTGEGMRTYQNNVEGAVHLCIKVPTAGGKTFIACNALKTIFDNRPASMPKAVVWLVPWSNLLGQTVKHLSDPDHPYCQRLNALFAHRMSVYEKKDLLQGASFNPAIVQEQLSIMVLNFASVRAKNKDDRKIYEQNGMLASFAQSYGSRMHLLPGSDETSLINVIRSMNPVLVVDESHNAESELSVDMLRDLNPSFILDLTATPKNNANIISLVPAIELKKEHMVKLPVIVYNQQDRESVIESAIHLQHKLETLAKKMEASGGRHIRPMVLFQAQSKTKDDHITFGKLKEQLTGFGIPEEEIRVKTANIDELKDTDLMSRECRVRYVITVNALKEGWDCPFAYILASLADRSSEVDVTQILGRVLRQPYVTQHNEPMLNLSYVITASAKFNDTLQNIVSGLRESGFSENDYRGKDTMPEVIQEEALQLAMGTPAEEAPLPLLKEKTVRRPEQGAADIAAVAEIEAMAQAEIAQLEKQLAAKAGQDDSPFQRLSEVGIKVKQYRMRPDVAQQAKAMVLPKFVLETPQIGLLDLNHNGRQLLDRVNLLKGFRLSDKATDIHFDALSSELYQIDLENTGLQDYKMSPFRIESPELHSSMVEYILAKPREAQLKDMTHRVIQLIGKVYPIPDGDIRQYVRRVLEGLDAEQLRDCVHRQMAYTEKIKQRISLLADEHAEIMFREKKEVGQVSTEPLWKFPEAIAPARIAHDIGNSLYVQEGEMNGLEEAFIRYISACSNIAFWHRNLGRGKGFALNGYKSDHYPDFIIATKSNKILLVETKGADRDNSDSTAKLKLGKAWAELSGQQYKYLMVFEQHAIEGAYTMEKAKELIMQM